MTDEMQTPIELMTPPPSPEILRGVVGLVTPTELARALSLAEQTLAAWRSAGKGPAFVKLGKSVFYRLPDIEVWISESVTHEVIGGPKA